MLYVIAAAAEKRTHMLADMHECAVKFDDSTLTYTLAHSRACTTPIRDGLGWAETRAHIAHKYAHMRHHRGSRKARGAKNARTQMHAVGVLATHARTAHAAAARLMTAAAVVMMMMMMMVAHALRTVECGSRREAYTHSPAARTNALAYATSQSYMSMLLYRSFTPLLLASEPASE